VRYFQVDLAASSRLDSGNQTVWSSGHFHHFFRNASCSGRLISFVLKIMTPASDRRLISFF
jgi:hypothetical protein